MKIQTKDLDGDALKWAALTCDGWTDLRWKKWAGSHRDNGGRLVMTSPSGLSHADFDDLELDALDIIDQGKFSLCWRDLGEWSYWQSEILGGYQGNNYIEGKGQTPSIAVLRCYVARKLGDEVEVPDILDSAKAHEVWAAAQLAPGEGIEDGVARIQEILKGAGRDHPSK